LCFRARLFGSITSGMWDSGDTQGPFLLLWSPMLRSLLIALKAFGLTFFLMRHRHSILCIALVASSCCCQAATADQPTLLSEAEMQAVRSMSIEVEPRLKDEKNPSRIALLLRNAMHWRIPFLRDTKKLQTYNWMDIGETYRKSLFDSQYGHACGGRAIQYLAALRAFGIPARKVGFLTEVENARNPVDAHATVEVLIDGKWIAMDPHFNFSLADENGELIGWVDAAKRLQNDDPNVIP
jgi:Transglutaminase-like superfamily